MKSLEHQVREGLIQSYVDEAYKQTQEPEYHSRVNTFLRTMLDSISENLSNDENFKDEFPKEEIAERITELRSEIEGQISSLYTNPEAFKQQIHQQVQQGYMTKKQWKAQFRKLYKELGLETNTISRFQEVNEKLYGFLDLQDTVVKELTKIAGREGIEKALTAETQNEVTRALFPTKEEYVAHTLGGIQFMNEYIAQVQQVVMKDEGLEMKGQILRAVCGGIQTAIEEFKKMTEQATKDKILKNAQEIYGA